MHNFTSAAAGMAIAVALIRGFARQQVERDRQLLGGYRPRDGLCAAAALDGRRAVFLLAGRDSESASLYHRDRRSKGTTQTIAQGPVASQEAIKMLGTNGGGFFNANSAHPFENPTPLTNFVQMLLIFLIPAGSDLHLRQDGRRYAARLGAVRRDEPAVPGRRLRSLWRGSRPAIRSARETAATRAGGNMEGKEVRFGIAATACSPPSPPTRAAAR